MMIANAKTFSWVVLVCAAVLAAVGPAFAAPADAKKTALNDSLAYILDQKPRLKPVYILDQKSAPRPDTGETGMPAAVEREVLKPAPAKRETAAKNTVEAAPAATLPQSALPAAAKIALPAAPQEDVQENPGFALAAALPPALPTARNDLIAAAVPSVDGVIDPAYTLGIDDEVHMIVYGEPELSGDYIVGSTGTISVPLIGEVAVNKLTLRQAEHIIATRLADGYLIEPSVSLQIAKRRPFYIMGEVRSPGSYSYVSNMTVMNAVAMAGGFTYRARQGSVEILKPENDGKDVDKEASVDARVAPGDIILVKERFF